MSILNLNIPAVPQSFYNDTAASANKAKITGDITAKYGKYIDNIAALSNVPAKLIKSFIFIESGGNQNAKTPSAIGLMQVGKATASDVIVKEKSTGRLRPEEEAILKKYIGQDKWTKNGLDKLKPNQKSTGATWIGEWELLKPEFNLMVGSILLGQLIDEFTENGVARLDKVVVVYNTGRYSATAKKAIAFTGGTAELIAAMPSGQADYIKKLLGKNGTLDVLS